MNKIALFSLMLVFLVLKTSTTALAQPSPNPGDGATGLLGINVTTELFTGFGPFIILENGQAGNDYFSIFGFTMEYFNSNGMDWILSSTYNDPSFVTALGDVFASIKGGETWDVGTNLISNISGSFDGGLSFASLQFENPPIQEGFPGDDPKNPNLTFGGSLDIVLVDGLLSFGGDLTFLMNFGGEIQEYHLVTGGKLSPFEGFTIETGFDINNILQPNGQGIACGAFFQPHGKVKQKFGKKDQWQVSAGVRNPFHVGKLANTLPTTVEAGLSYKFKL